MRPRAPELYSGAYDIDREELLTATEFVDRARLYRKEVDLQAGYAAEMVRREMSGMGRGPIRPATR